MYCKECGKEIDEDSIFCSFCGTKVNDARNKSSEENESLQNNENSEIFKLIFNKMLAFPVSLTSRHLVNSKEWWNGELSIASNAILLCNGKTFAINNIIEFFLKYYNAQETTEDNIASCFKSAVKAALHDYKHKKAGDLYIVCVKEWWKYRRELYCIVQITDTGYKYIDGVVTYF